MVDRLSPCRTPRFGHDGRQDVHRLSQTAYAYPVRVIDQSGHQSPEYHGIGHVVFEFGEATANGPLVLLLAFPRADDVPFVECDHQLFVGLLSGGNGIAEGDRFGDGI